MALAAPPGPMMAEVCFFVLALTNPVQIAFWITGFPAGLVAARRHVEAVAPLVTWLSAAVLAGSGLRFLTEAVSRL